MVCTLTKPTSPVNYFNKPGVGESKRTQWFVLLLNQRHLSNYFNKPGVGELRRTQWFVILLNQRRLSNYLISLELENESGRNGLYFY